MMNAPSAAGAKELLAHVRVVLKDPTHPGNIGATARALKTMGLSRLVLVAPRTLTDDPQAIARAAGATDILAAARVVPTLAEAIADCAQAFAYTARRRDLSPPCLLPRQAAAETLQRAAGGDDIALVFGGERSGLTNEDILQCGFVVEIPASPEYASLNLAQAAQIAAYELRQSLATTAPQKTREMPNQDEFNGMINHWGEVFRAAGLPKDSRSRLLLPRFRRILARAEPDKSEVQLLRGICRALKNAHSADKPPTV